MDIAVLALPVAEAARSVGSSESVYRREVLSQVRSVQGGLQRLVAVVEPERWPYFNGRLADEE